MGFDLASASAGLIGGVLNYQSQRDTNEIAQGQAQNQMNFQERMSNTAHQREVEDLKAAGLNPILSAGKSGATTPAGGQAALTAPQISLPDMMSGYVSMKQLDQKDKEIGIDQARATAEVANKVSSTDLNKAHKELAKRGLVRADAEGEASAILRDVIRATKKAARQSIQPSQMLKAGTPASSGGNIVDKTDMDDAIRVNRSY